MATWVEANGQAVNLDLIEWVHKHGDQINVHYPGEKEPRVLDLDLKTAIWTAILEASALRRKRQDR